MVLDFVKDLGVECSVNESYEKGSEGAVDLAEKVIKSCEKDSEIKNNIQL